MKRKKIVALLRDKSIDVRAESLLGGRSPYPYGRGYQAAIKYCLSLLENDNDDDR